MTGITGKKWEGGCRQAPRMGVALFIVHRHKITRKSFNFIRLSIKHGNYVLWGKFRARPFDASSNRLVVVTVLMRCYLAAVVLSYNPHTRLEFRAALLCLNPRSFFFGRALWGPGDRCLALVSDCFSKSGMGACLLAPFPRFYLRFYPSRELISLLTQLLRHSW